KEQLTSLIEKESVAVSITIDFWTSRRNQGYIGITCAWISDSWEFKEALLVLQHVLYSIQVKLLLNCWIIAIVYFPSRLQSDESAPVRKDDELNDILCSFEEIIMLLSGNTYVTISLMYLAILTLVKTLKILLQQSYIESASTDMGELTILDSVEEVIDDTKDIVEIKEVDVSLGIIHKTINISVPMIIIGMLAKVKKVLYDSMYHYWNSVTDVSMLACLLDPHFKKLHFANTNVVIQTKEHLKSLYELECEIYPTSKRPTSLSNIQHDDHDDFEAGRIPKK
ncbi:5432_t:CDS:2, partial [Racocetra persica]